MRTREEHLKSWFDQQLRTARVARLPIYARGKTAQRYAFEREMASAQDCETPSDGYNIATGDYRAADGTTAAPAHRVAPDADQVGTMFGLLDTVQVGWVDIGTRLLLVDGRRTVARWDYLNVAPWKPAPVLPALVPSYMVRRAVERPSRVARVVNGATAALDLPTSAAVWQASIEPQRGHRWSLALEAAGTYLLHNAGQSAERPDVWSKRHRSFLARPDRSAFKGTARYTLPQPCRYGAQRGHLAWVAAPSRTWQIGAPGTAERQTVQAGLTMMGGPVGTRAAVREAWRGHQRITLVIGKRARAAQRAARAAESAEVRAARLARGAVGTRGPARSPWSLSARSLPAAAAAVADAAATLEGVIRTSTDGAVITFTDGTSVTVIGAAQVHDATRGRAYPVREWSRRAALARLELA